MLVTCLGALWVALLSKQTEFCLHGICPAHFEKDTISHSECASHLPIPFDAVVLGRSKDELREWGDCTDPSIIT